jgi:hypothetical protein
MFESASDAVAAVRGGVDALLDCDFSMLHRQELTDLLCELERQTRRLAAVDHEVVAEVDQRNVAGELACTDTAALLSNLLRIAPREASARVRDARELGPRHEITGAPLAPLFPAVAAAQVSGEISPAHAHVITRLRHVLPDVVDKEHGEALEAALVEHAAQLDPAQLAIAARRARELLDPDGALGNELDHNRRRSLHLHRNDDGSGELAGHLTASATAAWQTILDALSAPQPAEEGEPDVRSAAQRRHDGFLDAAMRLLRSGSLPDSGGAPVTILVRIELDDLIRRTGHANTEHGGLIGTPELLRLASEADVVPVVCDSAGGVLSYGRTRRIATPGQRRALALRDGGCSFPSCTAPASWCETHHVVPWIDGGRTDLDSLTLLCGFHHREFEQRGWSCTMIGGVPHWIPPAWLDPDQVLRRNTAHHIDIRFDHAS